MKCAWHCCVREVVGTENKKIYRNKRLCCKSCSVKSHVAANRKKTKERAVYHLGGKCVKCGYDKCLRALQFHHTDPNRKNFGISENGYNRSWEKVIKELEKCILLCSNCHAEEEDFLLCSSKT